MKILIHFIQLKSMKKIILIIVGIIFSLQIFAQEEAVKEIKTRYYEVNEDNFYIHSLTFNSMKAAIGMQTTDVKYYFFSWQKDPETDPYLLDYSIAKIEITYNISASMNYTIEYLFDENENLIFYFYKAEGMWENEESRYYLEKDNLIKCTVNKTIETGEEQKYTKTKKFSTKENETVKKAISKAKKYIKSFYLMLEIEEIDK